MDKKFIAIGAGVVALAVVAFLAFKPMSEAQTEMVEFNKKCRAAPTLVECKDWKDSTSN